MSSNSFHTNDTADLRLAEQLRHEALAERPPFSADLHARVLAAVAKPGAAGAVEPSANRSIHKRLLQWSFVAAGLAAAAFGFGQLIQPRGDASSPENGSTQLAHAPSLPSKISFDDLNHGAGIALRLVVDQLPIEVPADDWGLPAIE